jgi:hypothetical protein
LGEALAYNRNVLVTAPGLIVLAVKDAFTLISKILGVSGEGQE